jgi:hypothetical protein
MRKDFPNRESRFRKAKGNDTKCSEQKEVRMRDGCNIRMKVSGPESLNETQQKYGNWNERRRARREKWREAIKRGVGITMGQYGENRERATAVQKRRNSSPRFNRQRGREANERNESITTLWTIRIKENDRNTCDI